MSVATREHTARLDRRREHRVEAGVGRDRHAGDRDARLRGSSWRLGLELLPPVPLLPHAARSSARASAIASRTAIAIAPLAPAQ